VVIPAVLVAAIASWHPLHASSATVELDPGNTGTVTIRAFADELPGAADSARAAEYLGARFLMTGADALDIVVGRARDGKVVDTVFAYRKVK